MNEAMLATLRRRCGNALVKFIKAIASTTPKRLAAALENRERLLVSIRRDGALGADETVSQSGATP